MTSATIDALVPAKGFRSAKERLAGLLSASERAALARAMMTDVLMALIEAPQIAHVWVISQDADALELAATMGARPLAEAPDSGGLNAALEAGRRRFLSCRTDLDGLLVVPTDLPGATAAGISEFLGDLPTDPLVRLCPSPDGGTNGLFLRPPAAIEFRFGPQSARRHAEAASDASILFELRFVAALQTDIDLPDDLAAALGASCGPATSELLARIEMAARIHRWKK